MAWTTGDCKTPAVELGDLGTDLPEAASVPTEELGFPAALPYSAADPPSAAGRRDSRSSVGAPWTAGIRPSRPA